MVLVGGGLGNAVLFSIGAAMRAAGSQVLYFAGYKKTHRPLQDRARSRPRPTRSCGAATKRPGFDARAPQDKALRRQHRRGDGRACLGQPGRADDPHAGRRPPRRDRLRRHDGRGGARAARRCSRPTSSPSTSRIGSINSPMQCMMKEICAQCLQPHVDPGDRQDELRVLVLQPGPAARPVDFPALRERLAPELAAGKAHGAVDRPRAGRPRVRSSRERLVLVDAEHRQAHGERGLAPAQLHAQRADFARELFGASRTWRRFSSRSRSDSWIFSIRCRCPCTSRSRVRRSWLDRQGGYLRLRRHLHQAGSRHGGDEDRHGGGRGGARRHLGGGAR